MIDTSGTSRDPALPMVGLIGAGVMGTAMTTHLIAHGYQVIAYDIAAESRERIKATGAKIASTLAEIASTSFIISSLPSTKALEAVAEQLAAIKGDGTILIETSTLCKEAKQTARERIYETGFRMLDTPLSGTGAQAANRDIVVLGSGDREDFDLALPILRTVARSVHYLGPFGAGMTMKLLANHLVAIHSLATAEVLAFASRAGVDPALAVAVLQDGAGASRMLQVRGPAMAARNFEPVTAQINILIKDIALIHETAMEKRVTLPLLDAASKIYSQVDERGWGNHDICELYLHMLDLAEDKSSSGALYR